MYYDITQEVFSAAVYPGDTPPSYRRARDMARGDGCTVTDLTMCAHNGTHADAPSHFVKGGRTAERLELSRFAGRCAVRSFAGAVTAGARVLQNKKTLGWGSRGQARVRAKKIRSTSLSKKSSKPRIFVQASEWEKWKNKKTRKVINFA